MSALGWIFAVILVALMLPLLAFLYLDVLTQKAEVKQQTEKVEKLRREIERKNRDKTPNSIDDNPVFDRLRKQISIRMPRSDKLE
jgi:di/tricarboxylate transporter